MWRGLARREEERRLGCASPRERISNKKLKEHRFDESPARIPEGKIPPWQSVADRSQKSRVGNDEGVKEHLDKDYGQRPNRIENRRARDKKRHVIPIA